MVVSFVSLAIAFYILNSNKISEMEKNIHIINNSYSQISEF